MAPKTFAEIAAAYRKDPYPFPMPDGATIMIAQPTIRTEGAAVAAATSAPTLADGLLAGLRVYADPDGKNGEDAEKIAAAWGAMPTAALNDAVNEMRDYFVKPNS
jgi:hypothetical protein